MREQLERRRDALKAEFEAGQKALAELEGRTTALRNTLLRISGAIQVLEEELGDSRRNEEPAAEARGERLEAPATVVGGPEPGTDG